MSDMATVAAVKVDVDLANGNRVSLAPITLDVMAKISDFIARERMKLIPTLTEVREACGELSKETIAEAVKVVYELRREVSRVEIGDVLAFIHDPVGFNIILKFCVIGEHDPVNSFFLFNSKGGSDSDSINRWLEISGLANSPDPSKPGTQSSAS